MGAKAPGREALAFGEQCWTWAELDDRVHCPGALRASDLGPAGLVQFA